MFRSRLGSPTSAKIDLDSLELRELFGMERLIRWLPPHGQSFAIRFVAASVVMAAAFVLSVGFARYLELPGLSVLLFGIFMCAVLFNHGTGFYAGALAIIAETYTMRIIEYRGPTFAGAVVFSLVCAAVALFGESLRLALERAVTAERTTSLLLRECRTVLKTP